MKPTTVVIGSAEDLLDMVVACAPFEMSETQMRLAYLAMLNRAITHGKTWHEDWHTIWPELDGEWMGLVEEMCVLFPSGQITMKPSKVMPGQDRLERHRNDYISDHLASAIPFELDDGATDRLMDQWLKVDKARPMGDDVFHVELASLIAEVVGVCTCLDLRQSDL